MKKEAGNILLAGVGAAALTIEKASDIISGWVQKGKLTVEDGKELTEELKRNITSKGTEVKETVDSLMPITKDGLREILQEMNFATRSDVLELKRKVEILENRLNEISKQDEKEEQ